jgi:hypothetical protein
MQSKRKADEPLPADEDSQTSPTKKHKGTAASLTRPSSKRSGAATKL